MREKHPIDKWWKWIFYIFGFVYMLSPIFWIVMIALHYKNNKKDPLINNDFHYRMFIWGIIAVVSFIGSMILITI